MVNLGGSSIIRLGYGSCLRLSIYPQLPQMYTVSLYPTESGSPWVLITLISRERHLGQTVMLPAPLSEGAFLEPRMPDPLPGYIRLLIADHRRSLRA
ncbi:MAG: hypothetical protein E7554_04220 [Ruminococcaceae bacterium]|nr:hypothetical protein [Oscillospiraceae bacterium]